MRLMKFVLPVLTVALASTAIACKGELQIGSKQPDPVSTTSAAPVASTPPADPPKEVVKPKLVVVGKATVEDGQIKIPGMVDFNSGSAGIKYPGDPATKE